MEEWGFQDGVNGKQNMPCGMDSEWR
jgi:hypothetical protein